jgi:short subunit dehydrogenase-like uncharacterized protein
MNAGCFSRRRSYPISMTVLVYGAYGYTGELIVREAVDREVDVVVAGRNGTKTRGLGIELDVESRVFEASEAGDSLEGIDVILNCAGPFVETAESLVDACLATGTTYLDITGEVSVFEALAERDRDAEKAEIALLPGIGFDVVPTDCLAAHLHDRLPGATRLRLGVEATGTLSGGTLASVLEHADSGGKVRRDGVIKDVPVAADSSSVDFGNGLRNAVSVPLGDVSTAYYSTGIENIETYVAVPNAAEWGLRLSRPATALLAVDPLRKGLQGLVRRVVSGPSERTREQARTYIWGEATDGDRTVVSRLETPEPYSLTVDAATTAVARLDSTDEPPIGYQTPATAFGPEFVCELDGVEGFFDE